jgi:hypothetical protein
MKRFLLVVAATLVLTAAPVVFADTAATTTPAASAGAMMAAPAGSSYEVVCAKCYVTKGAHGADHMACGAKCVMGGGELALLKGSKLYVPVDGDFNSLRDQFKDKVGQSLTLDGKVESKGGVNYLVIETPTK